MNEYLKPMKETAKDMVEKAKMLIQIFKLDSQITTITMKENELFKKLGKDFFNEVQKGVFKKEELSGSLKESIYKLEVLNEEVDKLEEEIKQIKAQASSGSTNTIKNEQEVGNDGAVEQRREN
jgi:predicted  nucleic acid-binding Zn-ribbon protein